MGGCRPLTSKLIREALSEGPRCVWEIYRYVKGRPAHYKRRHVTYRAVYNMLYVLRRLMLVERLANVEVERELKHMEMKSKRIKSRYARAYYALVDGESEAWNNPYGAYNRRVATLA